MKKYSILVATAIASLTAFTSCDDSNDCGCECNVPVIENVEKLDDPGVTVAGNVEAGSYIAIFGKNLGNVTAVRFGNKTVSVKPAYRSDNTIALQVPTVTKSCVGELITSSCPDGYENAKLSVVIGTPTVYMMYNEFVPDGGILKLKGSSFVGDQMQVDFVNATYTGYITVSGSDIELKGTDGTEMYVKVPAGAGVNSPIIVRNAAEVNADGSYKQSFSPMMFRDYRNMLVDFDYKTELCYSLGAVDKAADGTYSIANFADSWVMSLDNNYSLIGTNNFGVFHNADNWEAIDYAPDWDVEQDHVLSIFGDAFRESVKADPSSALNYVVKFEVNVPESNPSNYAVYTLGIVSSEEITGGTYRAFSAPVQMSEITWDKSDAEAGWTFSSAKNFSTDGWMTVTVPLSEFVWNLAAKNYQTSAQNFVEGAHVDSDDEAYGDPTNHTSYCAYYSDKLSTDDDLYDFYGGLIFGYNPYDGPENSSTTNKAAHVAIDNIRVVPNDGNGAIYPKLKFGAPTQHYYDNPRIKSFN